MVCGGFVINICVVICIRFVSISVNSNNSRMIISRWLCVSLVVMVINLLRKMLKGGIFVSVSVLLLNSMVVNGMILSIL